MAHSSERARSDPQPIKFAVSAVLYCAVLRWGQLCSAYGV